MKKITTLIYFLSIFILICSFSVCKVYAADLVLGVPPFFDVKKCQTAFEPLARYLEKETAQSISLIITNDYEELKTKIQTGEIDIGIFTSVLYVQTKDEYPELKYLATATSKKTRRAYYFGYFIAHKESGLKNLSSLRQKSFAFVSKNSSSGYKYPMAFLKEQGIDPNQYFKRVEFLGKHDKLTDSIASKQIDCGVTWDENLKKAEIKHGKVFRKIKKLGPIINQAVAANHEMSKEVTKKILRALVDLSESVTNVKEFPYSGFQTLSDKDYNFVRSINE